MSTTINKLIANPNEFAKKLGQELYYSVVETTTNEIVELIRPKVKEQVEEHLKSLKAFMEREYFSSGLLIKVMFNETELEGHDKSNK
jgi:hypothetical protein